MSMVRTNGRGLRWQGLHGCDLRSAASVLLTLSALGGSSARAQSVALADAAAGATPASRTVELRQTVHVCNALGLSAIDDPPPHNFPGADAAIMDYYRPIAPGLAEESIPPGANPNVPRVFGTDLGAAYEHSDGKLHFNFGDSAFAPFEGLALDCPPDGGPCTVRVVNDDVVASTSQKSIPTPSECLNLSIPSLERDPGEYAPVTFQGYETQGGFNLGPFVVPGPGFSTGKFAFASMPATPELAGPPLCTLNEGGNNCAQVGGIEGDVCLPVIAPNLGFCYFGECGFDPNSPCALRFAPRTLGVRETSTNYVAPQVGVHITSQAVLDPYRGHFSANSFASQVDWKTNDGKVWVVGRDSFWGMPGMNMSPHLLYHPVSKGVLGEAQYFAGMNGKTPVFSPDRTAAKPLYIEDKMVTHHASLGFVPGVDDGVWVMLYGGHIQPAQRAALEFFVRPVTDAHFYDPNAGIYLRWAKKPWGPWSPAITIFNAFTPGQGGYCENMYFDDPEGKTGFQCPAASEARNARLNRLPDSGHAGEYAPVILPRFTQRIARDKVQIHWLLTTSNPYRVVLMRSELGIR